MLVGTKVVKLEGDALDAVKTIAKKFVMDDLINDSVDAVVIFGGSSLDIKIDILPVSLKVRATGDIDDIPNLLIEICKVVNPLRKTAIKASDLNLGNSSLRARTTHGRVEVSADRY